MVTYTPFYDIDGNLVDNMRAYCHLPKEEWLDVWKQRLKLFRDTPIGKVTMDYVANRTYRPVLADKSAASANDEDPIAQHYDELDRGTWK